MRKRSKGQVEHVCPTCSVRFFGIKNRSHSFCPSCQSKKAGELSMRREAEEHQSAMRTAMLDDILADEHRMPWERKYK